MALRFSSAHRKRKKKKKRKKKEFSYANGRCADERPAETDH
jgi:hypothetical protein